MHINIAGVDARPCPCNVCWPGLGKPQSRYNRSKHKRKYGLHPNARTAEEQSIAAVNAVLHARVPSRGGDTAHLAPPVGWALAGEQRKSAVAEPGKGEMSDPATGELEDVPCDLVAAYERDWEWILNVADEVGIGDQFGIENTNEFDDQPVNALSALFAGMATRFSGDDNAETYVYNIKLISHDILLISYNIKLIGLQLTRT